MKKKQNPQIVCGNEIRADLDVLLCTMKETETILESVSKRAAVLTPITMQDKKVRLYRNIEASRMLRSLLNDAIHYIIDEVASIVHEHEENESEPINTLF